MNEIDIAGGVSRPNMLRNLDIRTPGYPWIRNFKPSNTRRLRKALTNVRTGTANGVFAIAGDSTNAGHGAGTGANGFVGARRLTPAFYMAEILERALVHAQEVGVFGGAGIDQTSGYDPRLVIGSGWSGTSAALAGNYWQNSTTTEALAWTPTIPFDTIRWWYRQRPGQGTMTIDVDGSAALATVNTAGPTPALIERVETCKLGTHTINFKRVSGAVFPIGWTVYDSTKKVIDVWNLGIGGAPVASLNSAVNPWNHRNAMVQIKPDVILVDIGINDWPAGISGIPNYIAAYQEYIDAIKVNSDPIIVNPQPSAIAAAAQNVQDAYTAALEKFASDNDLPYIDVPEYFISYDDANALGMYYDIRHGTKFGYAQKGGLFARALQSL